MKTLEQKQDEEPSSKKTKMVSFPIAIVEDILSRLPVKSILRSRSVSKTWLSLISHPSFNKLQFTRATESHRMGLFFSAYDHSNHKCYFLSAAKDGGPLTLLMTVDEEASINITERSHVNGLVCFTSKRINYHAFVVNPSTRKIFKLPDMNCRSQHAICGYLYGLDESIDEYKILLVKYVYKTETFEFMIYSMSSFSWRKIVVDTPVGFDWERLFGSLGGGVCVDSVVHVILPDISCDILAFNFVTEKFSVISIPHGVWPPDVNLDEGAICIYRPVITKIDGCLGVVYHDRERSKVGIWLLQEYDKRVWVKETIKLPESWKDLVGISPLIIDINMDGEIFFSLCKVTGNLLIIPVYNRKSKCFKILQFNLDDQFTSSKTVSFYRIKCYVENIMPLKDNWSIKHHRQSD